MPARIYQRPKNAMQSGKARIEEWLLEFDPAEAKRPDPVMGWAGSGDTQSQVTLKFADQADAVAYAEKYGIAAVVHPTPPRRLKKGWPTAFSCMKSRTNLPVWMSERTAFMRALVSS